MDNIKIDNINIAVVGAGLAGSAVGYYLKKNGVEDVHIFEEKKLPRKKLCGGIVSEKGKIELLNIFDNSELENIFKSKLNSAEILVGNISTLIDSGEISIVDRKELDFEITKKYINLGGKISECDGVISIDKNKKTLQLKSGKIFRYNICIVANGVFGFDNSTNNMKNRNFALEQTISIENMKEQYKNRFIISFDDLEYGYSWIIPKGDEVVIGVGAVNGNTNLKVYMENLLIKTTTNIEYDYRGAFLPNGKNILLQKKDVYYIGDASGIISPITGEGIYYSLYTARIISECIKNGNPEISYIKKLNNTVKRVKKEIFIMKFIYNKKIQKLIFGSSHKKIAKKIINSIAKKYIVN